MSIQNHVTSLELSKQLYEAGIVVESEFVWEVRSWNEPELPIDEPIITLISKGKRIKNQGKYSDVTYYPAPLASELGNILRGESINFGNLSEGWIINWVDFRGDTASIRELKLTDAMAKMLLYLKDKGLLL